MDAEIEKLALQTKELQLGEKLEYVLRSKGKHVRADFVLLSGLCVGGKAESLHKLCLAIEMLHSATLVHDDILDHDEFRRNAISVQAKWGTGDAILVGDALASLSLKLACSYNEKIVEEMAQTCLMLSDGEYMDVQTKNASISKNAYFEKIKKKSASLFKAASKCGAIAGNGTSEEITHLAAFGENYGLAYQIKDDVTDVSSIENFVPSDIMEYRATLPVIHAYENSSKADREFIEKIAAIETANQPTNKNVHELIANLDRNKSFRYCNDRINEFIDRAINELAPLKESVHKNYLCYIANSLRPRECISTQRPN